MRFIVPIAMLFIAGSAEASFRHDAPHSMHLIESGGETGSGIRRVLLAQANPEMSAPPLLTAPDAPPAAKPEVNEVAPLEIAVDPYAGTFVGKEILAGAGLLFGFDVLAGGALMGVLVAAVATGTSGGGWNGLGVAVFGVIGVALAEFALSPLVAALGVYLAAPNHGNNGLGGAIIGAYAAQLGIGALSVIGYIALYFAAAGDPTGVTGAANAISLVGFLVYAALHYVGMPLVSSLGVHWTGAVNRTRSNDRRGARVAITPDDFYVQAAGPRASPLLAIRF